ncbi:cytochrome P450 [Ktedonobacter sp. SOSP1-52]|uniref:cytochrome P450 n=1 Tax=Ktedonobacter sp. SOSP1-52 TaxID=2778366 RepID=UPI00191659CA|nr:cytochrome P450 [Ktedonobacter sp. SOSP1-52]
MTHRLPELYKHPSRFMPARWSAINRSPYEYLPFSAGYHRCIGAELVIWVNVSPKLLGLTPPIF